MPIRTHLSRRSDNCNCQRPASSPPSFINRLPSRPGRNESGRKNKEERTTAKGDSLDVGTIFTHRQPVSMESTLRNNETFLLSRTRVNARTHGTARHSAYRRFYIGFLARILGHFSRWTSCKTMKTTGIKKYMHIYLRLCVFRRKRRLPSDSHFSLVSPFLIFCPIICRDRWN